MTGTEKIFLIAFVVILVIVIYTDRKDYYK